MKQRLLWYGVLTLALLVEAPTVLAAPLQQEAVKNMQAKREKMVQTGVMPKKALQAGFGTIKVTVLSKSTDSFTARGSEGKDVTVRFDSSTQWRRRFWGKSEPNELNVNDLVNVFGKWNNEEKTDITARLIRNVSIQKRQGVFFGTVSSVQGTTFVMATIKRGNQTVTTGSTRFIDRKGTVIQLNSIASGHRVRVRGLWDSANNTITEVTEVKDFDLPLKATPTVKQ